MQNILFKLYGKDKSFNSYINGLTGYSVTVSTLPLLLFEKNQTDLKVKDVALIRFSPDMFQRMFI